MVEGVGIGITFKILFSAQSKLQATLQIKLDVILRYFPHENICCDPLFEPFQIAHLQDSDEGAHGCPTKGVIIRGHIICFYVEIWKKIPPKYLCYRLHRFCKRFHNI